MNEKEKMERRLINKMITMMKKNSDDDTIFAIENILKNLKKTNLK